METGAPDNAPECACFCGCGCQDFPEGQGMPFVDGICTPCLRGEHEYLKGEPDPDPVYSCPCCGYRTLSSRNNYEICPICFWEDDGSDDHNLDDKTPYHPNSTTLRQARKNFLAYGACDEAANIHVRKPTERDERLRVFNENGDEIQR